MEEVDRRRESCAHIATAAGEGNTGFAMESVGGETPN